MDKRFMRLDSVRAVEALAEVNHTPVIEAEGYASTTLPDAVYYYQER